MKTTLFFFLTCVSSFFFFLKHVIELFFFPTIV